MPLMKIYDGSYGGGVEMSVELVSVDFSQADIEVVEARLDALMVDMKQALRDEVGRHSVAAESGRG